MLFSNIEPTTLYKQDAKGTIREWTIYTEDNDIVISYGLRTGAKQEIRETVSRGKASRNIFTQMQSRVNSRINKQLDKGYKETLDEALKGKSNSLGLIQPMLAIPWQKVKNVSLDNSWVQYKYDGHRCLVTKQNGKLIAYSRNSKIIDTIGHILAGINLPEGWTLDGELYCHGVPLQELSSWIKRKQADTYRIQYHIYDLVLPSDFTNRYELLTNLSLGEMIQIVPTWHISEIDSIQKQFLEARVEGYEGLILRQPNFGYENGKRSKSLLKVKQFYDDEFKVVDIIKSEKGRTVLWCITKDGKRFKVSPPGTLDERDEVYENQEKYLGQYVQVEFSLWTHDGIPFQGVGTMWRDKYGE